MKPIKAELTKQNLDEKALVHVEGHQEGQWNAEYIMVHLFGNAASKKLLEDKKIVRVLTCCSGSSKTHVTSSKCSKDLQKELLAKCQTKPRKCLRPERITFMMEKERINL